MQIAKKGLFWIVLNIILIPSVFALEWPTANDFLSIYQNYYGWVDFFLAFMIFASIARLFVEKKFGTESTATKPLYVSLGLVLAIALVTWEVQSGFYLFQMGFVSLILLLILLGVIIYNLIGDKLKGKDSKLDWAHLLFSLAIILFAILLFYPGLLAYIPIADPDRLMGYAAAICGLVALWFFVKWLLGRKKGGEKESPPKKNEPPRKDEPPKQEKEEKDKTPEVKKATIIVKDEKNNVGTKFTQGAKLAIGLTLEKSNVQIKDLKLEWILKDASTKLNCVFSGKGSGYFAGDKEIIEFDTSPANIGLISDKSKKIIDIILNIIDPNTNKVLMEKKEDIKILPSGTTPTEEPPEQTGNPIVILKDNNGNSPKKLSSAVEIVDSNSYRFIVELNKDAKNIKGLKIEWLVLEIDENENPKGGYIPISLMDYKRVFAKNPELIYSDLLKTIRIKGYKNGANFFLYARLMDSKGEAVKNKTGNVYDYIAIKIPKLETAPPPSPSPQPTPAGKTREPEIQILESATGSPSRVKPVSLQAKSRLIVYPNQVMLNYMKSTPTQFLWYAVLSDSEGNETGTQIPIAETINLEIDYNLITKQKNIIKGNIYKIYCLAADSVGNWITKSDGKNYVFDFILVRIDYPNPLGPNRPGPPPSPSPKGKTKEPDEIIPKEKNEEIMPQPPGIITITAEKQNPVAVQRDSTITIENSRAYEIGYAMQKELPRGTIISFILADPQTHQMKQLGRGEYPLSIPIKRNIIPLNNYIVQIIFTYQGKSLLADWFNLKVVSALPAAYQVKGLLASGKQEQKTRLNKEDIFAVLESKIPEYAKDESTKKLRAGRKPYYPNFREYLEKIYKTGGRPLAVILREKGYEINDKEIEEFITPKLKEYFAAA